MTMRWFTLREGVVLVVGALVGMVILSLAVAGWIP